MKRKLIITGNNPLLVAKVDDEGLMDISCALYMGFDNLLAICGDIGPYLEKSEYSLEYWYGIVGVDIFIPA